MTINTSDGTTGKLVHNVVTINIDNILTIRRDLRDPHFAIIVCIDKYTINVKVSDEDLEKYGSAYDKIKYQIHRISQENE